MIPSFLATPPHPTPLHAAVLASDETTVDLLLQRRSKHLQRLPESNWTCRDLALYLQLAASKDPNQGEDFLRKQRIFNKLVTAKVVKDNSRLAVHGAVSWQSACETLADLVKRESLCKLQMKYKNYQYIYSENDPNDSIFFVPKRNNSPITSILRDKTVDTTTISEWEVFVYKLTLVMNLGGFVPIKKMKIDNPNIRDYPESDLEPTVKVALQPFINPADHRTIPRQAFIRGLMIQIFLGLGDANLSFDPKKGEIVHFDIENALPVSNGLFIQNLKPIFHSPDFVQFFSKN